MKETNFQCERVLSDLCRYSTFKEIQLIALSLEIWAAQTGFLQKSKY